MRCRIIVEHNQALRLADNPTVLHDSGPVGLIAALDGLPAEFKRALDICPRFSVGWLIDNTNRCFTSLCVSDTQRRQSSCHRSNGREYGSPRQCAGKTMFHRMSPDLSRKDMLNPHGLGEQPRVFAMKADELQA